MLFQEYDGLPAVVTCLRLSEPWELDAVQS